VYEYCVIQQAIPNTLVILSPFFTCGRNRRHTDASKLLRKERILSADSHRAVKILSYLHLTWRYVLFHCLFRYLPPVTRPFCILPSRCLSFSMAQMAVRLKYHHFQTHYHICVVDVCTRKCQMYVEITATLLMP